METVPVRVEVYINRDVNEVPSYVYDKVIPIDAIKDLEKELDTCVGQYPDNPEESYEYAQDVPPIPAPTLIDIPALEVKLDEKGGN